MLELLLPLLGFFIGILASMTGIGGGVFIVPVLTLIYVISPAQAVGTSLATIIFTAIASTANYSRQKRIYYKTGLIMATTTVPGAYIGAYLTSVIPPRQLGLFFGIFLIFVALRMIFNTIILKSRNQSGERITANAPANSEKALLESKQKLLVGVLLSFFGGLASGVFGVGGGVLLVPIMDIALTMAMHVAVATSMFTMIFTSISGVTQHQLLGNIRWEYALPLIVGTVFGAQVGAFTSKKLSGKNLQRIFGVIVVINGIQMILKYM